VYLDALHYLLHVEDLEADRQPHNFDQIQNSPSAVLLGVEKEGYWDRWDEVSPERGAKV
jgi:hypothetical protein